MEDKVQMILKRIHSKLFNSNGIAASRQIGMVYLSDWRHAIMNDGMTITTIGWRADFLVNRLTSTQLIVRAHQSNSTSIPIPSRSEKEAIDHVINVTATMSPPEFSKLVYSTYPMFNSSGAQELDLCQLAREYDCAPA